MHTSPEQASNVKISYKKRILRRECVVQESVKLD
jgi:hypothetical protein